MQVENSVNTYLEGSEIGIFFKINFSMQIKKKNQMR